tara:strand:+ start:119 stop:523 length:405 start_codon:yes stop_codon:yes gene_type:complete
MFKKIINLFGFNKNNNTLSKFTEGNTVTYTELESLPIGEPFYLPDNKKVETIRLDTKSENSLSFRVTMKGKAEWKLHRHDCTETILIYKGQCKDLTNNKEILRGGLYIIPPFRAHHIISEKAETIFYVEFKKPI